MLAMAKSGQPCVIVLLFAVLAVAISLHATTGAAAIPPILSGAETFLEAIKTDGALKVLKKVLGAADAGKEGATIYQKRKNEDGSGASAQGSGRGSTQLIENKAYPKFLFVGVTEIKVGDSPTLDKKGSSMLGINDQDGTTGGVLVSSNLPLTFLNGEAYKLLEEKISDGRDVVKSDLGDEFDQPCYKSGGTQQPITLVFDGGDEMKVEAGKCWYKQSEEVMCLAIVKSPWTSGQTIIGTKLQALVNVNGDKLTFQKSTNAGSASGTSSKSNTAAATKPLLGAAWALLLLLLAYIAC